MLVQTTEIKIILENEEDIYNLKEILLYALDYSKENESVLNCGRKELIQELLNVLSN